MRLPTGRYERLRMLVVRALEESERTYADVIKTEGPDSVEVMATEDAMEEWALLLHELDASVSDRYKKKHGLVDVFEVTF